MNINEKNTIKTLNSVFIRGTSPLFTGAINLFGLFDIIFLNTGSPYFDVVANTVDNDCCYDNHHQEILSNNISLFLQ